MISKKELRAMLNTAGDEGLITVKIEDKYYMVTSIIADNGNLVLGATRRTTSRKVGTKRDYTKGILDK